MFVGTSVNPKLLRYVVGQTRPDLLLGALGTNNLIKIFLQTTVALVTKGENVCGPFYPSAPLRINFIDSGRSRI